MKPLWSEGIAPDEPCNEPCESCVRYETPERRERRHVGAVKCNRDTAKRIPVLPCGPGLSTQTGQSRVTSSLRVDKNSVSN